MEDAGRRWCDARLFARQYLIPFQEFVEKELLASQVFREQSCQTHWRPLAHLLTKFLSIRKHLPSLPISSKKVSEKVSKRCPSLFNCHLSRLIAVLIEAFIQMRAGSHLATFRDPFERHRRVLALVRGELVTRFTGAADITRDNSLPARGTVGRGKRSESRPPTLAQRAGGQSDLRGRRAVRRT